ncbi:MAG: phosphodiester glycosidase family protein [Myxococcota bacterium]
MSAKIWLDACRAFAVAEGVPDPYVDALHAFAYPNPRGGPPPPPEPRWSQDFEALERTVCAARLQDPSQHEALTEDLAAEVDRGQAELFARRVATVETALCELGDATGRLLRVGLRQRLVGIRNAPRPRALRVRAVADYYYSFAGRWLHERDAERRPPLASAIETLTFSRPFAGAELARLEGTFASGPVHAHILRLEPGTVRPRVVDCRASVRAGTPFAAYVESCGAQAAVSGGFFLYSEPDIEAPEQRYDPVGLLVEDGRVRSPPVFPRGALMFDDAGRWRIDRCGPHTVTLSAAGHVLPLRGLVTRSSAERGPAVPSIAVVRGAVVGSGSALPVPLGGFVLPCDAEIAIGDPVEVSQPRLDDGYVVHQGIAGGPLLLRDGQPCIDLRAEGFWGTAPPRTFSQDETGDRNALPRLAAGIDAAGRLVLAAIDGRNFSRALGMTLREVAALMQQLGCVTATNLDGGSSKRMVVAGRTVDLASTEVERKTPTASPTRPVHTAILFQAVDGAPAPA